MFKRKKAFTAVETVLTLGVIAITAGMTIPMFRNLQMRTDLDLVTEQTIQGLKRAQVLAQSGEQDLSWGFYVQDGVLFAGEAYAVRENEFDEVSPVPSTISTSGLPEVIFSQIDGVPDRTGEIIIQAINGEQRIIEVGLYGALESGDIQLPSDSGGDGGDSTGGDSTGGDSTGGGSSGGDSTGGDSTGGGSSGGDSTGGSTGGDGGSDGGSGGDGPADCEDRFAILSDGTIEATGTVNVEFEALGAAITYGAGGPNIKVTVEASVNNGETWFDLFNGKPINGGETQTVQNLVSGSKVLLRVKGRYSWLFNKTYTSNDKKGHVIVLKNGDAVPDIQAFGNQASIESFLQGVVVDGKTNIGQYDAIYLVELGSLGTSASDFQDAVIKVQFTLAGSCAVGDVPRFKVDFPRVDNTGNGNAQDHLLLGEQGVPYAAGQWVPLTNEDTSIMLDNFLTEDVQGMAAWRNNGYVRFLQHGTHGAGSKEIVDATITFDNAKVTNIVNDQGQNKTENPFDEIVNDGPGGDEVGLTGSQTVLYQTRVTTADDAILVYWEAGNPPGGSSGGDGGSDGGSSGGNGGDDDQGGDNDDTPDPCAVNYSIADGVVTINEVSDVTFRTLGSHATYGSRGPEISTYLHASLDGGTSYETLFSYRDIDGGERQTFSDVAAGAQIVLKGDGRYSWLFRNSTISTDATRVKILKRKDPAPTTSPYQNVNNLKGFMRNVVDSSKKISIGKTSLLFVFELQDIDTHSDYQDIAVEVFLEKPASSGICGGTDGGTTGGDTGGTTGGTTGGDTGGTTGGTTGGDGGDSGGDDEGEQVTICHFPPGNKKNPQTLTIGEAAVKAHLKHGDREGSCESDADGDTVANEDDFCINTYMPESVPRTGSMLFKRYALTHNSPVFRTGPRKKFVGRYTLEDTKGCSCEQLIDVAEKKNPYYFKQVPRLYRNMRSLFPFYTRGARNYGCGRAILKMVKNFDT